MGLPKNNAMTLILSTEEAQYVDKFCEEKRVSKIGMFRRALGVYRALQHQSDQGHRIFIERPDGSVTDVMLL